jgi:hypothetical protein
MGRADSLGMQYVMKVRGDSAVTMSHPDAYGRNFVTLRPQQNSLNIEIFGVTGRVPYYSSEEIDNAMVPQKIKEKYDEIGGEPVRLDGLESDWVSESQSSSITIFQKFLNVFKGQEGEEFSRSEIIDMIVEEYPGTNRTSLIPSDYCYNIINKGIPFQQHIFDYLGHGRYRYLGQDYEYTGLI